MAIGDELVRNNEPESTVQGPLSESEIPDSVEVADTNEALGEQVTRGQDTTSVGGGGDLGRAIVNNRREIPSDDNLTPDGAPAPSEVKAAGDAVKKAGEIMETPGGPEAAEAAGLKVIPTEGVEQKVERGSRNLGEQLAASPTARRGGVTEQTQEAAEGQAGVGQNALDLLKDPATQKALASLGAAITPSEEDPLRDFVMRAAEGQAQEEFRNRLQAFGEEGAGRPSGLSPEGAQSVLQQFRTGEQQEFQREATEERLRQGREKLRQQAEEILIDKEELDLREEEMEKRFNLRDRRTAIAEASQDLEEMMAPVERRLKEARIKDLREEDRSQFVKSQLKEARMVSEIVGQRLQNVSDRLDRTKRNKTDLVSSLPTESSPWWPFSGTNVSAAYDEMLTKADKSDKEFSQALEDVQKEKLSQIPEEYREDVQRALQQEAQQRGLEEQAAKLENLQDRANDIVMNSLGGGQANLGPTRSTSEEVPGGGGGEPSGASGIDEAQLPSFKNEAQYYQAANAGIVQPGDTVKVGGQIHRAVEDEEGFADLQPIE